MQICKNARFALFCHDPSSSLKDRLQIHRAGLELDILILEGQICILKKMYAILKKERAQDLQTKAESI